MSDLIDRQAALDAIDSWRREYPLDLQEPIDDCWNAVRELPAVQPGHVADVSKKVSISCAHENDVISREAAIEALARMMPRSYTPDGSHPADEEIFMAQEIYADCIEAIEILPTVQPEPTQEIQDILDYLDTVLHPIVSPEHWDVYSKLHDMVSGLPSTQPDGIPLEWIDKHLEWLDNCDNDFAQLAKVSIKAMVELWKKDRI